MFLRASYRHKSQKHCVFAGILSPHVLKLSLPGLENKTALRLPALENYRNLSFCATLADGLKGLPKSPKWALERPALQNNWNASFWATLADGLGGAAKNHENETCSDQRSKIIEMDRFGLL